MKTKKQITAIITVLFMGFSTLYGQTSVRDGNGANPQRSTVKRTEVNQGKLNQSQTRQTPTREVQSNPNVRQTQARQTPTREVQSNPNLRQTQANTTQTRQPAVQSQRSPDQRNTTRYNETASRQVVANKPVSISTPHNPKSDYHAPNTHTYVKENKFSEKRYYGGHYYHHVYPGTRIKTNYHHDTYIHHYNVLYYPAYHDIFWTHNMYRDYSRWYPKYNWRYNYGYRINTISIFDAQYNLGEVAMVYGRVYATWYNRDTDDYLLFFGGDYPAQQFTVVLPGNIARRFNWRPERYFLGEHMTVTGLITTFDGIPEIIVKNKQQVGIY